MTRCKACSVYSIRFDVSLGTIFIVSLFNCTELLRLFSRMLPRRPGALRRIALCLLANATCKAPRTRVILVEPVVECEGLQKVRQSVTPRPIQGSLISAPTGPIWVPEQPTKIMNACETISILLRSDSVRGQSRLFFWIAKGPRDQAEVAKARHDAKTVFSHARPV